MATKKSSRKKARTGGRPRALTDQQVKWIVKELDSGRTYRSVAEELGVTQMTLYRAYYKRGGYAT